MPTAIAVTSPDLVLSASDRHTPSAAVLQSVMAAQDPKADPKADPKRVPKGGAYSLDRAIVEMHTLIEHHGYVIVLCPESVPDLVVHRLHAVRSVLESDRIAILRPELPPLGLAVLALQLRQLTMCDFSPGVLASAARLLAHYIYAGAVLGSVARLDRVPVSLKAHAKSWMPGAQFAVLATPQPELVRLTGPESPTLAGPAFGTRMFYAAGQQPTDWITGTLAPAWQVQGIVETRLPAESARWWATGKQGGLGMQGGPGKPGGHGRPGNPGKIAEFAAAIPDISVLYQLVSSVRRETCHWCGLELIGDRCGFCAAPLADPPATAPHAPPPGRALAPATGPARAALPPAARP
ncbi:hypothetical protein EOT10_29400 [Streptomyces antnestii]|uniref:Uncharacterized protein n=1 Tax=Streptomyces antnestii TaxID=2494256 RepID=A0A3S2VCJ8_9ACTN|nr:hypothetical protein EOT10_29400 [Streptomyces sp. San01]